MNPGGRLRRHLIASGVDDVAIGGGAEHRIADRWV
jgi:hypothetical protein